MYNKIIVFNVNNLVRHARNKVTLIALAVMLIIILNLKLKLVLDSVLATLFKIS